MSIAAKPMLMTAPNGGSYSKSALLSQQDSANKQTTLINVAGGRRKRKNKNKNKSKNNRNRHGGANNTVELVKMPYTGPQVAAGSQSAQSLANQGTINSVNNQRQGAYDACIGQGSACTAAVTAKYSQTGGKKRVHWGCMSGGTKKRTKKSKKSRKSKKSKKSRK